MHLTLWGMRQERGGEGCQVRQEMDKGDQYVEPALRVSRLETSSLAAEAEVRLAPVLSSCCSSAEISHCHRSEEVVPTLSS